MTRWSAITRTRGRHSALAYGSRSTTAAEDNLNRLVHHEQGRYLDMSLSDTPRKWLFAAILANAARSRHRFVPGAWHRGLGSPGALLVARGALSDEPRPPRGRPR